MAKRPFNGSPTVDGYYTTFDSSEVHRVDEGGSDEGGGGGSSDFSIANVTFINSAEGYHYNITHFPFIADDKAVISTGATEVRDSITVVIPLYKGKALIELSSENPEYTDMQVMPTVTGGVSFVQGGMLVTGDGSVTFSGTQINSVNNTITIS